MLPHAIISLSIITMLWTMPWTPIPRVAGAATARIQQESNGGPEMEKLRFLVGTWSYVNTYLKGPFFPAGGDGTGTYTATLGPGGFSLITTITGKEPTGDASSYEVITWDIGEKVYKGYSFNNVASGCNIRTGKWENGKLVFSSEISAGGKKLLVRFVYAEISNSKVTIEASIGAPGGALKPFFTTKAIRK